MKIIGLTGNSGTGKSTICGILRYKYSAEIIDADKIARKLTEEKTDYLEAIVEAFRTEILDEMEKLNRRKLAEIIYSDDEKRKVLNEITFKYVVEEIKNEINNINDSRTVVIDAPLLFESRLNEMCDITIGVIASEDIKIERICQRDWIEKEEARARLEVQLGDEYLRRNVDYVIENDNSIQQLEENIEKMFRKILA